jgi:glucose-6-phosphate isomerase
MGGSSLAPEVIAQTYKKKVFILDSTDPDYLHRALQGDASKMLVLVASKSGSTIETSSQRAFFEKYLGDAGLNPTEHMVFVTDPGSPLDQDVRKAGFTVINADPHVGGRFSALTAFGLTPAALMGVDASVLLDQASDCRELMKTNPEVVLDVAYLLLTQAEQFLGFTDSGSKFPGLSDWIEQLIAESTRHRAQTQPLGEASSGCIFRNVPNTTQLQELFPQFKDQSEVPAGFLIDQAGLKGERVGGIEISQKHAAFFVNTGSGSSDDVMKLIDHVKTVIHAKFGVQLQEEVFYLS